MKLTCVHCKNESEDCVIINCDECLSQHRMEAAHCPSCTNKYAHLPYSHYAKRRDAYTRVIKQMGIKTLFHDNDNLIQWDSDKNILTVDGIKISADFLIAFVHPDGNAVYQFRRENDMVYIDHWANREDFINRE